MYESAEAAMLRRERTAERRRIECDIRERMKAEQNTLQYLRSQYRDDEAEQIYNHIWGLTMALEIVTGVRGIQ